MQDERRETYQRLVVKLLALPGVRPVEHGRMVLVSDVICLLATEFLTERRGVGSQSENIEEWGEDPDGNLYCAVV
jgi:hypothetical protein